MATSNRCPLTVCLGSAQRLKCPLIASRHADRCARPGQDLDRPAGPSERTPTLMAGCRSLATACGWKRARHTATGRGLPSGLDGSAGMPTARPAGSGLGQQVTKVSRSTRSSTNPIRDSGGNSTPAVLAITSARASPSSHQSSVNATITTPPSTGPPSDAHSGVLACGAANGAGASYRPSRWPTAATARAAAQRY